MATPAPTQDAPAKATTVSDLKVLFVHSRIGRRLMVSFLIAALLPVLVLGVALLARSNDAQRGASDVTRSARAYGALLAERLAHSEQRTRVIAAGLVSLPAERWPLAELRGREFTSLALVATDGQILRAAGEPLAMEKLRGAIESIAAGKQAAFVASAGESALFLIARAANAGGRPVFLVAAIDREYLAAPSAALPDSDAACISTASRAILHCTRPFDAAVVAHAVTQPRANAPAVLRWEHAEKSWQAASTTIALPAAFDSAPWTVTAIHDEPPRAPGAAAVRWEAALAAALAVALALLLTLKQMRRILVPLERLLLAAQGMAERDFSVRVAAPAHDEFGRVAAGFNTMAERLGLHFRTLDVFSEIDKTILLSPDLGKVAKLAMDALKDITGVQSVSLGLAEPGSRSRLRVYQCENGDGTGSNELAPAREITWNPDPKLFAGPAAGGTWQDEPLLPNGFLQTIRIVDRQKLFVLPIVRNRRVWGLIVLVNEAPVELSEHRLSLVRDIADRLAVALSTSERDRRLHVMAHLDALTGLPNRQHMLAILDQELAQAQSAGTRLAVLFVDLDRFKETNDTLGHPAGDVLLKRASERIRQSVRESDQVGRHGGDEFTVVLNDIHTAKDASYVARKLVKAMHKPFEVEGHSVYAGASVGIALFPDDGSDGADLVRKADTAMYRAKEDGRGRYAFFEQTMNVEMNRRVTLDRELRQALECKQFVLHYQPQFDLRTGQICSAEALLRWQHPTRGLLAPSIFIELAEETGLIETLGTWVLREACLQHARWLAEGISIPRVAVNVSSRQMRQPEFVASVYYAMAAAKMQPDALEVEVTESLILDGGEAAIEALRALEKAAAKVAIDDFGTGYSSFTYLNTLPASILKLDKSFITNVTHDRDAATIATAIINMAHTLRKEVVAEGVETHEQIEFLRGAGCEKVQGYYLSPPLPADKLAALARLSESEGLSAVLELTRERMRRIAARKMAPKPAGAAKPQPEEVERITGAQTVE